jgi:hypothetical protein
MRGSIVRASPGAETMIGRRGEDARSAKKLRPAEAGRFA